MINRAPELIQGEVFLLNGEELAPVTLYSAKGMKLADKGTIWATNYRTIFRFYETGEYSIPHGNVLRIVKEGYIQEKEEFSFYCRSTAVEIFAVPLLTKPKKELMKQIQKLCAVKSVKKLFCFSHPTNTYQNNGWKILDLQTEFTRQGVNMTKWRISTSNTKYEICAYYPSQFLVPAQITDDAIILLAQVRVRGRVQVLTWGSSVKGHLLRAAHLNYVTDDMTGFSGAQFSKSNEVYLKELLKFVKVEVIHIFDCCSNKEFPAELYTTLRPFCMITCLGIPNENTILDTLKQIVSICSSETPITDSSEWLDELDKTGWFDHISKILSSACAVVNELEAGNVVLIQNDSGKDILSVLSALSQILIDPFYRTVRGLCTLIEKEFIYFGNKFASFTSRKAIDEYSSIFLLFLDSLWQILQQFPLSFQFSEDLLLYLMDAVYSCQFGTFIPSCEKERSDFEGKTPSVWSAILDKEQEFYNPLYCKNDSTLQFNAHKNRIRLWSAFYLRQRCKISIFRVEKGIQTAFVRSVKNLEFSCLKIPTLPCENEDLSGLTHVTSINLSDNLLNKIPLALIAAVNLKTLKLTGNLIPFIAEDYLDIFTQKVTSLETLDLNSNQLVELSDRICRFKNLRSLKVNGNILSTLPNLSSFSELIELDIGQNNIDQIPAEVLSMTRLEKLNISSNMFNSLPETLVDLTSLQELNVSSTPIAALPKNFQRMKNLSSLNISAIDLEGIPVEILTFTQLTSLSVGNLKIAKVPEEIRNFKQLTYLDMSSNQIQSIPPAILELSELKYLFLYNNRLVQVPLDILKLDKLVELNLSHNNLRSLTPGIGKLENLRVLNVSNNNIRYIPGVIGFLSKLEESGQFLFRKNKHLRIPPPEVVSKGNKAVFDHLKETLEGEEQVFRMKIMLVGQENVGKTSLLRCLSDYVANSRKISASAGIDKTLSSATGLTSMSTDGIDIGQLDFNILMKDMEQKKKKMKVDLSVWDFAGQEIYYTTHQFFLSDRALYIVVWNMAKKEEHSRVEYWLKSINARVPDAPILIVATHADDPICTKEYAEETINALSNKYLPQFPNIHGIHTISCITQEGIRQLDLWIQSIVVEQPYMGATIPKRFSILERLVEEEKNVRVPPVVSWEEFSRMGHICNIKDQDYMAKAAEWLHNMGSIVYFQKQEELNDLVILDPQWLTDVMSTIVTTKHAFVKNGVLNHSNLPQLWRAPEFPPYLHKILLHLLEKFEISFYLRSSQEAVPDPSMAIYTGRSLVPSLLPDTRPNIEQYWSHFPDSSERQFSRRYKFGFIPHGFISRLFVRVLHFAEPTIFWKNGMLVEHNDDAKSHTISESLIQGFFAILIEAHPAQRYVDITIRGDAAKLAQLIIETIDSLIIGWYSIKVEIEVPCIHCIRDMSYTPYMFPIEECEQAAIDGRSFIKCSGIRDIRLDELVPDIAMIHVRDCKLDHDALVIEKEIGVGGFAVVYKGKYKNAVVAIKKISFADADTPSLDSTTEIEAFAEFRREVWLMSGLFHLNIVKMEGFSLDPFCIVTEFINHGNLYDIIHDKSKDLSWPYRWRCAMDIAKGMKYLHTTSWPPIIHRDLKSPNILVHSLDERAEAIAKVADFGLSQVLASTTQGRSVANPVWLAPEIMKSEEYTEKADVYSYGVILYELASRENFFGDTKFMSALENRVIEGDRPLIPPSTPPEFSKVIQACWGGDPEARPSFVEVCDSLKCGMEIHCPNIVDIACADKEILPQRKLQTTGDTAKRKIRTLEEIEEEARAMEQARLDQAKREMNDNSKVLNHLHDGSIQCLLYLPPCTGRTNSLIWSGDGNGVITVWTVDGQVVETINAHSKQIFTMILVGDTVWTVSAEEVIRIYFARNSKLKKEVKNCPLLCLANVGKNVWGGSFDSYIYSFDAKAAKLKKKFRILDSGPIFCLHYFPNTGCVYAGTDNPDKSIIVVNAKGKPMGSWTGHSKKVTAIIDCNGYLWSCSADKTIMVWSADGECIRLLQGHTGPIFNIANTGVHVWSVSWDKKVILWDAEYQTFYKEFVPHDDAVSSVLYLPENESIWTASWDKSIRFWKKAP